jgi:hypothetical protein
MVLKWFRGDAGMVPKESRIGPEAIRKVDRTARRVQLSYPKWVPPRLPSIRPVPDIAGAAWMTAPDNAGAAADG